VKGAFHQERRAVYSLAAKGGTDPAISANRRLAWLSGVQGASRAFAAWPAVRWHWWPQARHADPPEGAIQSI